MQASCSFRASTHAKCGKPEPPTYGARSLRKPPVPFISGLRERSWLGVRVLVPATHGHARASESKVAVTANYHQNKAIKSPQQRDPQVSPQPLPPGRCESNLVRLSSEVVLPSPCRNSESESKETETTACSHSEATGFEEQVPASNECQKARELLLGATVRAQQRSASSVCSPEQPARLETCVQERQTPALPMPQLIKQEAQGKTSTACRSPACQPPRQILRWRSYGRQVSPSAGGVRGRSQVGPQGRGFAGCGLFHQQATFEASPAQQSTGGSCQIKPPTAPSTKTCGQNEMSFAQDSDMKLVVFDFDCTLSAFHVFASLSGIESNCKLSVPPPHARTEWGQVQRLVELDEDPDWGPGAFALYAFGGEERVAELRKALMALSNKGVECIICSRGLVGPIRKCLDQLDLLTFFSHTLGSLGSALGTTDYDHEVAPIADAAMRQERYLGSVDMDVQGTGCLSKVEIVANYVTLRGLELRQAIFLDDDINELRNSCVRTIHVAGGHGICDTDLQLLCGLVKCPCNHDAATPLSATPSTPLAGYAMPSIASTLKSLLAERRGDAFENSRELSKV